MAITLLQNLIDKQDNFEIIRDQIAGLLVAEVANQMTLAADGGKDPDDWKLDVYLERSNPFEKWLNADSGVDKSPIVNVWYDNMSAQENASNVVDRQKLNGIFNIDCYGYGVAADNPAGGHVPGDLLAAKEVQRAVRLVRNILMSSVNTYLQLRGVVWKRMTQSITAFQPQLGETPIQNVSGARVALQVEFNELSPQYEPETLELVHIELTNEGQVILAEFDYS